MKAQLPNSPRLALTGATGALGGIIADQLAHGHVQRRLLVRDPSRVISPAGAEIARFEYADFRASVTALEGCETVFMVSATEGETRVADHATFIDAAVEAGVRHIVYTSFMGAAADSTFTFARDHHETERKIIASGLDYTFLRDNFYLDVLALFAGDDRVITGPAGDGRLSAVARADVADCAVTVLRHPDRHVNVTYTLTGPEAISLAEVAARLTETTGKTYSYRNESVSEAYAWRRTLTNEQWMLDSWVSTYTAIASGELAAVSGDVERLIGRPALSLTESGVLPL